MKRTLWLVLVLSACSTSTVESPDAYLDDLESRLLDSESVEVDFHITSEGAVASDVMGTLVVDGDEVRMSARGQFMSQPVEVELMTVGEELRGAEGLVLGPLPPALKEGVLLGLTRMGLLHNVAMLAGGQAPDGTDGEMRRWVQVVGVERMSNVLRFGIVVAGEPVGTAQLRIEEGLPVQREQVVHFDEGEMRVVERYSRFTAR